MSAKPIQVIIRQRPPCDRDGIVDPGATHIDGNTVSVVNEKGDRKVTCSVSAAFGPESQQDDVFQSIEPLIADAMLGVNATIFAYGVTGSGKTHTMQGNAEAPGIIPRAVESVFAMLSRPNHRSARVSFTFVEILKDEVYDLLVDRRNGLSKLDLRVDERGELVVADLTPTPIDSPEGFERLYQTASLARKTARTNLNESSSRSHAIMTLHLEATRQNEGKEEVVRSKICLIDLAGSENNKETGNDAERMRESAAINKSLATLGNVVDALNTGASRVPYRDSKLTRILQDALGGTSRGVLLCCIAPGRRFARDTINTLNFACRARKVENLVPRPGDARRITIHQLTKPSRHSLPLGPAPMQEALKPAKSDNRRRHSLAVAGRRLPLGVLSTNVNRRTSIGPAADLKPMAEPKPTKARVLPALVESPNVEETNGTGLSPPSVLSDQEKEDRARVHVNLAREYHFSGDLQLALKHYRSAREYLPGNKQLSRRVTEMELAVVGEFPTPQLSGGTVRMLEYREKKRSREIEGDEGQHQKRSRVEA